LITAVELAYPKLLCLNKVTHSLAAPISFHAKEKELRLGKGLWSLKSHFNEERKEIPALML